MTKAQKLTKCAKKNGSENCDENSKKRNIGGGWCKPIFCNQQQGGEGQEVVDPIHSDPYSVNFVYKTPLHVLGTLILRM